MKIARILPLALILAGCAVGPDYRRPDIDLPNSFDQGGDADAVADIVADKWWTQYADPVLNELVANALERNTDMRIAVARIEEADANLRETGAAFLPEIDLGTTATRSRVSSRTALPNPAPLVRNDVRLALSTSFEIDFWGRLRRVREAARAQALASRYAREVVRLSLASLVTQAYFSLRAIDAQIVTTQDSLNTRRESLNVVQARINGGLASDLDLNQAQGSLADASVQLRDLQRQRVLLEHQLGTLTGKLNLTVATAPEFTTNVPPLPAVGLPSRLLDRRPDVRQAEQAMVSSNAQIGVAKAAYFPTITLNANDGGESTTLATVLSNGARIWSVGLGATVPLLDYGRTSSRVDAARAREEQALASYQKAAETAYREVADALTNLQQTSAAVSDLELRAEATRNALRIVSARYQSGYSAYLDVLDAQRSANEASLALSRNRLTQLNASVDLFKALGGGWDVSAAQK
ncbi:MAG TPA: efflux transporter outer membrane subunit [Usitatibacteraceae bacterium]